MDLKKIVKGILILLTSILFIGGAVVFFRNSYDDIFSYHKIQEENRNEVRQEYLNLLYKNSRLSKEEVINIIFMKDLEKVHGDFTESRPEDFIEGRIESYSADGNSISLKINSKSEKVEYDVGNLVIVDIKNESTSKLRVCNNILKTEDNNSIDLDNKKIYIIVNYVNDKNSDEVLILNDV